MQAVLLDIDGTLIHSAAEDDRIYRETVCAVLGDVRLRPSLADYDPVTDSGILEQVFRDNALDADPALAAAVREEFVGRIRDHVEQSGPFEPLPGARNFVRDLSAEPGILLAIATGGWGASATLKLASAGFDIDAVPLASADDAVSRTDIMRIACARACHGRSGSIDPAIDPTIDPAIDPDSLARSLERITYFGDGEWDRVAARALGWSFRAVGPALGGLPGYDDPRLLEEFCRGRRAGE